MVRRRQYRCAADYLVRVLRILPRGCRVTVADSDPQRRATASAMGATELLASVCDADTDAYDAVVECVGRPDLVEASQRR